MTYILLLIIQFLFISPNDIIDLPSQTNEGNIVIQVTGIEDLEGEILVGIYKSRRTFRKIKKVYKYAIKTVDNGEEVIVIENVPSGRYAIAIFQDMNGNRKFDTNFMGIPKEPFGFSTNFVVKRRAPKFKEVVFDHAYESNTEMEIDMQKW